MIPKKQSESLLVTGYEAFIETFFPYIAVHPLAPRHHRLWQWFENLVPGESVPAQIEIWPRGGAKSSTAELGVAYVGYHGSRQYCLYVSNTQEQADKHVATIAELFLKLGIERSINKYGTSKGWKRNEIRTATGFNVTALGLDTAARGIKLDNLRPDLIILDDIDSEDDTPKTTRKKIRAIASKILPAGSIDVAVLGIQNLILEDGVFGKLVNRKADYLLNANVAPIERAIEGLRVEVETEPSGRNRYRIVEGTATWEGQSLEVCEHQIETWGLSTFLRESQHEVGETGGTFFDVTRIKVVDLLPHGRYEYCRAWDLAATQGGGDYTAGVLLARNIDNGKIYVLDVFHDQLGADGVRKAILSCARRDTALYGRVKIRMPQDPGQAGVDQRKTYTDLLHDFRSVLKIKTVIRAKAKRAENAAEQVNLGNVFMVRGDWNAEFETELKQFREDESHNFDDQVDAFADAFNELTQISKWDLLSKI